MQTEDVEKKEQELSQIEERLDALEAQVRDMKRRKFKKEAEIKALKAI